MLAGASKSLLGPENPKKLKSRFLRDLVVLPSPASSSATPTATSSARRPSLPLRASTPVLSSMPARRRPLPSATFSPLASALRVPLSATLRRRSVTVVRSPGHQATTPP